MANPSVAEYWHMGDIAILLRRVTFLMVKGDNNIDIFGVFKILSNIKTQKLCQKFTEKYSAAVSVPVCAIYCSDLYGIRGRIPVSIPGNALS